MSSIVKARRIRQPNFPNVYILQYSGKIFFVEQGDPNLTQYLGFYCKDYSADLPKLIWEGAMEAQRFKGCGNSVCPPQMSEMLLRTVVLPPVVPQLSLLMLVTPITGKI